MLVVSAASDDSFRSDTTGNFSFVSKLVVLVKCNIIFNFFVIGMYDMLGNAWEWVSDEFKDKGRETKYVLRGGSYIDTADGKHNHKVTVTTRYAKPFWKIMILVIHTGYMQCFSVLYKGISYMSHLYTSQ